jgi:polysaccharide export outer membrane protein
MLLFLCLVCVLGLASPSFGQARTPSRAAAVTSAERDSTAIADYVYVIGPDDVLSVVFWRDDQLSGEVLVRPDGKISLPLLDDVSAAGLTPTQLRDRLSTEARRYVTEPKVTVVVKATNSRRAYITGQVVRPGQYPLASSMSVLQLIATAGGLTDFAKAGDIRVVRVEQGRSISLPFDYDDATNRKTTSQNIELKPGDTVIVP